MTTQHQLKNLKVSIHETFPIMARHPNPQAFLSTLLLSLILSITAVPLIEDTHHLVTRDRLPPFPQTLAYRKPGEEPILRSLVVFDNIEPQYDPQDRADLFLLHRIMYSIINRQPQQEALPQPAGASRGRIVFRIVRHSSTHTHARQVWRQFLAMDSLYD